MSRMVFIPVRVDAFQHGLLNFAKRLKSRGPIRIVAIGSSSTAGEGGIEKISFDRMIDPTDMDRLHQSDWSAQRIGYEMSEAIAAAAVRAA